MAKFEKNKTKQKTKSSTCKRKFLFLLEVVSCLCQKTANVQNGRWKQMFRRNCEVVNWSFPGPSGWCESVLGQESQIAPDGCAIGVWVCVYEFLMSRLAHGREMNADLCCKSAVSSWKTRNAWYKYSPFTI